MKLIDLPPTWLVAFLAAGWLQAQMLPVVGFGAWADVVGTALVVLGFALMGLAAVEFLRHRTTIVPRQDASALVASGIFRFTRNPIYLGDLMLLVGFGLRWDSILCLILAPVFVRIITSRFIFDEEAHLAGKFGVAFEDYRAQVRRWI